MIYTNVDRTHIRYIPIGSFIRLETGEFNNRFFGMQKEPVLALYKIVSKGGDFNATMDVYLTEAETGESRKIVVSPSRYYRYYVIEEI